MFERKTDPAVQYQVERVLGLGNVVVTPNGVESEGAGDKTVWETFTKTYNPDLSTPLANAEGRGDNEDFIREYYRTENPNIFALITKDAHTKKITAREVMKVGSTVAEAWNSALSPKTK